MALRRWPLKTLASSLFLFFTLFFAIPVAEAAKIDNLQVAASLDNLGNLSVNQSIVYDFEDAQTATVDLFIPLKYQGADRNFKLRLTNIAVFDSTGLALPFQSKADDDTLILTVSGGQKFFSGLTTFRLQYQAIGLVSYDSNQDLFYWNLTSHAWPLRIKRSQLQLTLPKKIALDSGQLGCLSGPLDKPLRCRAIVVESVTDDGLLNFDNSFELLAGESHQVFFTLPKGLIYEPTWRELILALIIRYRFWGLALLLPLIVIFSLYIFRRYRQADNDNELQSAPPSGLTPAELSLLLEGSLSQRALIAELLHLAIRGYLKITRVFNGVSDDYQLTQLQDPRSAVSNYQQSLLSIIFATGSELSLTSVGPILSDNLSVISDQLNRSLSDKGHLVKNILHVKVICLLLGLFLMVGGSLLVTVQFQGQFWGLVASAVVGISVITATLLIPRVTRQGRLCRHKIISFKNFLLSAAESSNQKNQIQFETYLPYSVVLGVEQDWAYQYKGVFLNPATWLSDSTIIQNYNSLLLVDTVDSFVHASENYLFN